MFDRLKSWFNYDCEYQIFVGLNDKDQHKQIISGIEAWRIIGGIFPDGCTIAGAAGMYRGENEKSLIVTIYGGSMERKAIKAKAELIRQALNQNQVIVTVARSKKTYWIG